jgi:hypothetical protein
MQKYMNDDDTGECDVAANAAIQGNADAAAMKACWDACPDN